MNGGLMQQGYPISPLIQEQSMIDGKTYDVQYFERAVFEAHPENARPNDVLLSLLGVLAYRVKYPTGAPGQVPNIDPGSVYFPETGKRLGGTFLAYFSAHGGVPQQGLPISDEFQERSTLDGKVRTVQYFERAVFEWNPSNQPPYNVLLSQLGTFAYKARYQTPSPTPIPTPEPPMPYPVIPAPVYGGQYAPIGSDHYLVWSEGGIKSNGGPVYGSFDARGLDLRTNRVITITNEPGDQGAGALYDNLVVWASSSNGCTTCRANGLYATDLATGTVYTIATGIVPQGNPGVSGRKVAWIESAPGGEQVKMKDLNTNVVTVIRVNPTEESTFADLKMSGNFITWREVVFNHGSTQGKVSYIKAYDLTTGKIRDAHLYIIGDQSAASSNYAVDGHTMIVQDPDGTIFSKDLSSNLELEFDYHGTLTDLQLHGDLMLFSSSFNRSDILGINLKQPNTVVPIIAAVPGSTAQYEFTMAGGRIIYVNASADPNRLDPIILIPMEVPVALK